MKILPPNREVLEEFARSHPDILVDMVLTTSMYSEGWCALAIEVIDDLLVNSISLPLLYKMTAHFNPNIRQLAITRLFDRVNHDDAIRAIWGESHLLKMQEN